VQAKERRGCRPSTGYCSIAYRLHPELVALVPRKSNCPRTKHFKKHSCSIMSQCVANGATYCIPFTLDRDSIGFDVIANVTTTKRIEVSQGQVKHPVVNLSQIYVGFNAFVGFIAEKHQLSSNISILIVIFAS
jgi:hypothetical protein